MSAHTAFRRQPVQQQLAQTHQATTLPAPTRGLIENENFGFMQPGAAIVCDNWAPTLRGAKLRGGCVRWSTLPETTPIISSFEYQSGIVHRMFAANSGKLYDVTGGGPAVLVKAGQTSGNYAASQLANASGDYLIAVNDGGDPPLRFDGSTWTTLDAGQITGPPDTAVVAGAALTYVWKYRNRWFFIEASSMNAWYLPLNATQGALQMIPLSGAATKGGRLLFGATWSIDAGDGIDDKCVFVTDQGELLIFTGGDPGSSTNWRQEGRYQVPAPMGMNAHIQIGGDLLIATIEGIIPVSKAITKEGAELQLSAITRTIGTTWRKEVNDKRDWPWTMKKWDEYGAIFVTWPGGTPGNRYCAVANAVSLAWCRYVGWDATCWMSVRENMFFGTQGGIVMQADRTGYDDGVPYVATLVGGWGVFQQQASTTTWHQARASFIANSGEPFLPQLSSTTDFIITIPQPPMAGQDRDVADVWDQGKWGPDMGPPPPPPPTTPERSAYAQWDQPATIVPVVRNTGWVSIGQTGYTHAPIVQVTVAQAARPNVELLTIDATFGRMGTNV